MATTKGMRVGLDIGRHSVKAAWADRRGGRPVITRVESLPLPRDATDSRSVIVPWLRQIGLGKTPCVIGLRGENCMFQPIMLAPSDPRALNQAAAMEVIQFNEIAAETMEYNFAPVALNPVERRMVLVMSRPTLLHNVLNAAREMDVNVVDIVPFPVAIFNGAEAGGERHDEPHMLIHLGRSSTEIAIGGSAGFMFGRAFSSGGQTFTDALAKARGIPQAQAEAAKLEAGPVGEGDGGGLRTVADLWISEVQSCLAVYKSLYTERRCAVQRIRLSGGGAALNGLPEYVAQRLGIAAERVGSLAGNPVAERPALYAAAAGLALSGLEEAPARISLLPGGVRDELSLRRQKPYWIAAAAAAALILAVSLVGGYRDQRRKEAHLRIQHENLQRMQEMVRDITAINAQNDQMRALAQPIVNLLRGAPLMRDLITLVANRMDNDDWLDLVCDSDSYFHPAAFSHIADAAAPPPRASGGAPRTEKTPGSGENFQRIIIQGFTRSADLSTVKTLIQKLESSGFVESADLMSDDNLVSELVSTNTPRDPSASLFVIDLKLAAKDESVQP